MAAISQLPSSDLAAMPAQGDGAATPINNLSSSALWVVIARGWSVAASAALAFILPKLFTDQVCGEALLIINLIGLTAMFASFGLPETMIRLVAERYAHGRNASIRPLVARCAQLLICTTFSITGVVMLYFWWDGFRSFQLPGSALLAITIAAAIVALAWQMVATAILRGLHEVKWANLLSGGQSGGPIAVTCFLVLLGFSAWRLELVTSTLAAQLLTHSIIFTAALTSWRLWKAMPSAETSDLISASSLEHVPSFLALAADALPIALSQVAAFCTLSADLWIAGKFLAIDEVAYYGSAKRLVLLLGIPEQLAMLTIIANIPDLHSRGKLLELQHLIRKVTTLAAIPAVVACLVLLLFPEQILTVAFRPQYKVAAAALMILALGQVTANYLGPCGYVLLMTGRRWTVLVITAVCGSSAIILGALGAYYGGMLGLAVAAAGCTAAQIVLEWLAVRYYVGIWCHASPATLTAAAPASAPSASQEPRP
ncbi:lipopolysaccharide biosynthesis protein [Anatilimnocola sp. NA78]|uniref:lipopolysaccharide biosynthesis protein n=1 Tax=Anatilimnocola sp. NA78 TaxID=3415683 RepID=UPI003CE53515